jgi:hypothetical protein
MRPALDPPQYDPGADWRMYQQREREARRRNLEEMAERARVMGALESLEMLDGIAAAAEEERQREREIIESGQDPFSVPDQRRPIVAEQDDPFDVLTPVP